MSPEKETEAPATPDAAGVKIANIQALARAGFPLIPLCSPSLAHSHKGRPCKSPGKSPTISTWPTTALGAYDENNLPGNYGVVLGAGYLVVDVDPRNFKTGDKPVTRLCKDLGITLKSFSVKTGGGGLHIYLRVPKGFLCINDLDAYPGVEFKSEGRQVVGPGSVHESGGVYTVLSGSPDIIVDAPQALLDLIKAPEKSGSDLETDAGTGKYMSDPGTRERFVSYLKDTAEPSVEGKNGDLNAFKVAAHGRDLGLAPEVCYELMLEFWNPRCAPAWSPDELRAKVVNAYKYAAGPLGGSHPEIDFTPLPLPVPPLRDEDIKWALTAQGLVIKNFVNLLNYLKSPSHGLANIFGYNEFTARVEFARPAPWHGAIMPRCRTVSDDDLKMLKGYLATKCKFEMPLGTIEEAVVITARANKFHPVREYLSSLKWDETPRLDNWLRDYCGAADDDYTRAVARKTLVAAVMRVFKPGCKFDHALVLEGEQGIGKSAICRILGGDEWTGDFSIDPHNKDTIQLMQGKWFIELAELEVARRSDSDALKAFISRQTDTARLAYGRLATEYPRQNVLIATKNPGADGTYLKDDTGNRRWWPVALKPKGPGGMVDFKGLKNVRNQLFAEAMVLAQKGERLDMDTVELKNIAKDVVKQRHADHAWTEKIAAWADQLPPDRTFLTSREVYLDAMQGVDKQFDNRTAIAISGILKALKWRSVVKRFGSRTVRGYERPEPADPLGDIS